MKFACDSCQTKYTIPDEKVRGKVLKIRCKKCGAVITVKEEQSAPPEPEAPPMEERTRVADIGLLEKLRQAEEARTSPAPAPAREPEPPPAAPAVEWFVMINGEQVGPLATEDLAAKAQAREIDDRSHVWRDGMADWKRAAEVPELQRYFAPPPPPPAPKAPPPAPRLAPPAPAPVARPSAAASFHGDDDDVPTVARPRPDLKAIFGDEPAPAAPPPEEFDPPSDPEPARAARSLDFDDDPPPARAPSNGAAPSPNLADLMGDLGDEEHEHTGAGPIAVSPGGDPFASVPDAPQMATSQIGEQTRFFMKKAGVTNRNPWWKYAIFILLVLGLPVAVLYGLGKAGVGGTVVIVDASTGEEKQVAKFSLENIKSNGLAALLSGNAPAPATAPKRPKKVADGDKKPTPVDPNAGDPKANLTAEQRKKLDDNSGKGPDLGLVGAGDPKDKPAGSGPVDHSKDHAGPAVDKGDGLSSEVVAKVVADNTSGFNKCVEDKLKRDSSWKGGKINLTVKIGPSGTVLDSAIDKADVAGSDVGTCILGKVKRMHFPRFGGEEPQEVQFPLLLTNGG